MAGVSKSTERLVNVIVCMGAAIVIFGAWQKITHQPLADFFLTAGLITEAVIFVVYAFLPPPGSEMHAIAEALPKLAGNGNSANPALAKMDKMLQEADITPANLNRLSDAFFVWSRWSSVQLGVEEVLWQPNAPAATRS